MSQDNRENLNYLHEEISSSASTNESERVSCSQTHQGHPITSDSSSTSCSSSSGSSSTSSNTLSPLNTTRTTTSWSGPTAGAYFNDANNLTGRILVARIRGNDLTNIGSRVSLIAGSDPREDDLIGEAMHSPKYSSAREENTTQDRVENLIHDIEPTTSFIPTNLYNQHDDCQTTNPKYTLDSDPLGAFHSKSPIQRQQQQHENEKSCPNESNAALENRSNLNCRDEIMRSSKIKSSNISHNEKDGDICSSHLTEPSSVEQRIHSSPYLQPSKPEEHLYNPESSISTTMSCVNQKGTSNSVSLSMMMTNRLPSSLKHNKHDEQHQKQNLHGSRHNFNASGSGITKPSSQMICSSYSNLSSSNSCPFDPKRSMISSTISPATSYQFGSRSPYSSLSKIIDTNNNNLNHEQCNTNTIEAIRNQVNQMTSSDSMKKVNLFRKNNNFVSKSASGSKLSSNINSKTFNKINNNISMNNDHDLRSFRDNNNEMISKYNVDDSTQQPLQSNRSLFLESYYSIRTQLPTAGNDPSKSPSFNNNIITPLNSLNECDAITQRLLSSPKRSVVCGETEQNHQHDISSVKHHYPTAASTYDPEIFSRRASMGASKITTDQLLSSSTNTFKSLELNKYSEIKASKDSISKNNKNNIDNQKESECDNRKRLASSTGKTRFAVDESVTSSKVYANSRIPPPPPPQQQQQPTRSLSVCEEDQVNIRVKGNHLSSSHGPSLNRAISLACEPRAANRKLNIIPLFGCNIESLEQCSQYGSILPPVINSLLDHIILHGIESVGIFRKSGVKSRILTLKQRIETNQNLTFHELNRNNEFSIYDIADLVKMWFRELKPVPILTKELIKLITNLFPHETTSSSSSSFSLATSSSGVTSSQTTHPNPLTYLRYHVNTSQQDLSTTKNITDAKTIRQAENTYSIDENMKTRIYSLLSITHRALLARALYFLAEISSRCETNQMTSQNLAICLTPSLCATDSNQKSILSAQKVLEYCIDNHEKLFGE